MSDKPKPTKTAKAKKAPAKAKPAVSKKAAPKASQPKPAAPLPVAIEVEAFFVAEPFAPRLSSTYPELAGHVAEFVTYDEAREHAIDYLIQHIESCEEQLWMLKGGRRGQGSGVGGQDEQRQ